MHEFSAILAQLHYAGAYGPKWCVIDNTGPGRWSGGRPARHHGSVSAAAPVGPRLGRYPPANTTSLMSRIHGHVRATVGHGLNFITYLS